MIEVGNLHQNEFKPNLYQGFRECVSFQIIHMKSMYLRLK
jgi:hypothetical protein